jgi:hypothetical protein
VLLKNEKYPETTIGELVLVCAKVPQIVAPCVEESGKVT